MKEIERKFLIDPTKLPGCLKPIRMAQGYLNRDPTKTVRIRVTDDTAYITVKGESSENGMSRFEWESEIDYQAGVEMLGMCDRVLDKSRYHMIHRGKLWEVDIFHGMNEGLCLAEIELESEDEEFDLPDWIIREVTGIKWYFNASLANFPYKRWLIDQ